MSEANYGLAEVPANRRFGVTEPPFIVEGVILLDRIAGRGIQSEGAHIIQRWVLDFLDMVPGVGFENAVSYWAHTKIEQTHLGEEDRANLVEHVIDVLFGGMLVPADAKRDAERIVALVEQRYELIPRRQR